MNEILIDDEQTNSHYHPLESRKKKDFNRTKEKNDLTTTISPLLCSIRIEIMP